MATKIIWANGIKTVSLSAGSHPSRPIRRMAKPARISRPAWKIRDRLDSTTPSIASTHGPIQKRDNPMVKRRSINDPLNGPSTVQIPLTRLRVHPRKASVNVAYIVVSSACRPSTRRICHPSRLARYPRDTSVSEYCTIAAWVPIDS